MLKKKTKTSISPIELIIILLAASLIVFRSVSEYYLKSPVPLTITHINSPFLNITTSNIKYDGRGVTLKLDRHSDCPVIIIGSIYNKPISNVEISNLTIDGNRFEQTREYWKHTERGVINNSGIVIQNARNVTIHNIIIKNCKSGGIVTTLGVNDILVDRVEVYNSEFDGVACYETTNSIFSNLNLHNNNAAGISLDNEFNNNIFFNCTLVDNNTGIFMRNSCGNIFKNIILNNKRFGVFIAQVDKNTNTACKNNMFDITRMKTPYDFHINDASCSNNVNELPSR